jgi:carbon-monoxide dehydrogenase small subunit
VSLHFIEFELNGRKVEGMAESRRTLLDYLRTDEGCTGPHAGCEHGVCGACTVLVDGEPARSCLMLAAQANGKSIETLEGLASPDGTLHPVQQLFREEFALQCGFCTPGFVMTMVALDRAEPRPDADEMRAALSGHLCRCTGYQGILRVVDRLTAGDER